MDKKSSYENIKNIEILKILWLKNMFCYKLVLVNIIWNWKKNHHYIILSLARSYLLYNYYKKNSYLLHKKFSKQIMYIGIFVC